MPQNKKYIPPDFDWISYLDLNPDLTNAGILNEGGAIDHWLKWGYREGRKYRIEKNESHKISLEKPLEKEIDYDLAIQKGILDIKESESADINFIIPVRDRTDFLPKTVESIKTAINYFDKRVNITISENSEKPEHYLISKNLGVSYIWTQSNHPFNKCFAMNVAVFFSKKTPFLIFHDIDCLIQSDFFIKLFENIEKKKCKAIQTFSDRRVLYLNQDITCKVLYNNIKIDSLSEKILGIDPPYRPDGSIAYGAPGGSICVSREIFFKVGGYDPYYFESYAPEDIFFG